MQSDAMQVEGASSVSGGGLETRGVPTLSAPSLPSRWSEAAKSKTLELSSCGKVVYHKGGRRFEGEPCAVRADRPIPTTAPMYYFELVIKEQHASGIICIGVSTRQSSLARLPGWDEHSYGYHSDDGFAFHASGSEEDYGPVFGAGDVVGCCVNMLHDVIFFTKNGHRLGDAFCGVVREDGLYPVVGVKGKVMVEGNFGTRPFAFSLDELRSVSSRMFLRDQSDMQEHAAESAYEENEGMEEADVEPAESMVVSQTSVRDRCRLVLEYLIYHGHGSSACALHKTLFQDEVDAPYRRELESIGHRQHILSCVREGDVDMACSLLKQHYPECLENDASLRFQLEVQRFLEMIRRGDPKKDILHHGRTALAPYLETSGFRLTQAFSLVAYRDPMHSPNSHLLSSAFRSTVARCVNAAIMWMTQACALELRVQHAVLTGSHMASHGVVAADLVREWLESNVWDHGVRDESGEGHTDRACCMRHQQVVEHGRAAQSSASDVGDAMDLGRGISRQFSEISGISTWESILLRT